MQEQKTKKTKDTGDRVVQQKDLKASEERLFEKVDNIYRIVNDRIDEILNLENNTNVVKNYIDLRLLNHSDDMHKRIDNTMRIYEQVKADFKNIRSITDQTHDAMNKMVVDFNNISSLVNLVPEIINENARLRYLLQGVTSILGEINEDLFKTDVNVWNMGQFKSKMDQKYTKLLEPVMEGAFGESVNVGIVSETNRSGQSDKAAPVDSQNSNDGETPAQ